MKARVMSHLASGLLLPCLLAGVAGAQTPSKIQADVINQEGETIGKAIVSDTPNGVLVMVEARDLPEGQHAFHVHQTGRCDPADGFKSAGEHFAPRGHKHGFKQKDGPHAGDMPNQFVGDDKVLRTHEFLDGVSLTGGKAALLDKDGSALIVHAGGDDYTSQPAGNAGDRIACVELKRQSS